MNTEFNPIRTLIVDDSESECELLRAELCDVDSIQLVGVVHDGVDALAYVSGVDGFRDREFHPYPDLILLDFQMPRCDGMEVLRHLSHSLHRPHIVLWSNTLDHLDVPLALRLGADMVCEKPYRRADLLQIIEQLETRTFNRIPVLTHGTASEPVFISH